MERVEKGRGQGGEGGEGMGWERGSYAAPAICLRLLRRGWKPLASLYNKPISDLARAVRSSTIAHLAPSAQSGHPAVRQTP